jgi:hypothetical protein
MTMNTISVKSLEDSQVFRSGKYTLGQTAPMGEDILQSHRLGISAIREYEVISEELRNRRTPLDIRTGFIINQQRRCGRDEGLRHARSIEDSFGLDFFVGISCDSVTLDVLSMAPASL